MWCWRGSPCVPATTNNTLGLCNITPLVCADCWVQYDTESPMLAMDSISAAKSFACPSYAHLKIKDTESGLWGFLIDKFPN